MSVDQYQRTVNRLDKEIADLEKKKATADGKVADEQRRASTVTISKNASATTVQSKMKQIARYQEVSNKAARESADLAKKIAVKKKERNDAYLKLQREQKNEQKKQDKIIKDMRDSYEKRIEELSNKMIHSINEKNSYAANQDDDLEYDVFISHAFEDKESFVDELIKQGLKVWYDTDRLKWGDSMREKFDKGLAKSRYGVVILSPNYIAEQKYWTKTELNGLFQVETINGKTILPIWHNLTKKQVVEYSPIIADRKAMTTAMMTAEEIAYELKDLLSDHQEEEDTNG